MAKGIIFCDLDGTLSDDRLRQHLLEKAHRDYADNPDPSVFDPYHQLLRTDPVWNKVASYLRDTVSGDCELVFISARTENFRHSTYEWFNKNIPSLKTAPLYLRAEGDARRNWEVKRSFVLKYMAVLGDHETKCIEVIDDDPEILQMFHSLWPFQGLNLRNNQGLHPKLTLTQATKGELKPYIPDIFVPPDDMPKDRPPAFPVDKALQRLAGLYRDRNGVYGDNYKNFGGLMKALEKFVPEGRFRIETEDDWNRMGVLIQIVSKITRYCANYNRGGHPDSLDDSSVYSQMLNELDREITAMAENQEREEEK